MIVMFACYLERGELFPEDEQMFDLEERGVGGGGGGADGRCGGVERVDASSNGLQGHALKQMSYYCLLRSYKKGCVFLFCVFFDVESEVRFGSSPLFFEL